MVVADTSPLNYLVLINQIHLLPELYRRVFIPTSVIDELRAPETPEPVQTWAASVPDWIEIRHTASIADATLTRLHAGEGDAISLALETSADALLIDERRGRQAAEDRGLKVIGTRCVGDCT
jgi:predicted nucleic acid-binding protein